MGYICHCNNDNLNKINEYITNLKELARKFNFSREDLETLLLAKDNRGVSAISVALSKK